MTWTVSQGACSGGGFIQGISISDDGQTMVINYDGSNAWIWNESTDQWDNLFHQDRLPADVATWGIGFTGSGQPLTGFHSPAVAVAPSDYTRIYAIARFNFDSKIWKSTDRGQTWTDTGFGVAIGVSTPRGLGPPMMVDPANPDHVLVSDDAGAIWRTTDGFATLTCLNAPGGPLASVLPSAVTTAATAPLGTVLTFGSGTIPVEVTTPPAGFAARCSDVTDSTAFQTTETVVSTTATTVTMGNAIQGTGVELGNTIVFGFRAGIAFDRSSAVVSGITQGVYIAWAYGASDVYSTTDGCASFAAVGTGGPSRSAFIACSHDGVVYICPYAGSSFPGTTPRRWQSSTWTDLGWTSSAGNNWNSVAADPNSAGHVCFCLASGGLHMSGDYGATRAQSTSAFDANFNQTARPRTSTDVPWMGPYAPPTASSLTGTLENSMSNAMVLFDPVESGLLWVVEGIGVWSTTPPVDPGSTTTIFPMLGRNKGQETLIFNQITRAPSGAILTAAQDRAGFRMISPTIQPTGDFGFWETGPLASIVSGWGIDYAKNDKNLLVLTATGGTWKSSNEGFQWTVANSSIGNQAMPAVQTSSNFVIFPNSGSPKFTTDGGTTLSDCLFAGSTITSGWGGFFWNRQMVCADPVDSSTYYAYNLNANASGGGLWRSTDGGENWTKMSPLITRAGGTVSMNTGSVNFMLTAIPGRSGHLLIGPGTDFNNGFSPMWSVDAGATWVAIPGTGVGWVACAGKELSGADYPAVYYAGFCSTDPSPTDAGVFVATDLDPNNTSAVPTWERCCRAPGGNMSPPKSMTADKDTFGLWFMASGGNGYTYGEFSELVSTPYQSPNLGGAGAPLRRRAQYESYDTIVRRQKIREIEALKKAILARGTVAPKMAEKAREFIPYNDGMSIRALVADLARAQQELEDEDELMTVIALLH